MRNTTQPGICFASCITSHAAVHGICTTPCLLQTGDNEEVQHLTPVLLTMLCGSARKMRFLRVDGSLGAWACTTVMPAIRLAVQLQQLFLCNLLSNWSLRAACYALVRLPKLEVSLLGA